MSRLLIDEYLREIESLRHISGLDTEEIIRDAFKDLLKRRARSENLSFALGRPR